MTKFSSTIVLKVVPNVRFTFWAWHFKKESTNHDRSYMQELRPDILGCNCGNGSNPSQ